MARFARSRGCLWPRPPSSRRASETRGIVTMRAYHVPRSAQRPASKPYGKVFSVSAERIWACYPFEVGHLPPHDLLDLFLGRSSFTGSDEHPKPLGRAFLLPVLGVYKPISSHRVILTVGVRALKHRRQLLKALMHLLRVRRPPNRAQFLFALALGLVSEHPLGRLGPSIVNP